MGGYGIRDHCGFVLGHSLHDVYKMTKALQHRGQDTAGIATRQRDGKIDVLRWYGLVDNFSLDSIHMLLQGEMFIGHVRYATSGEDDPAALFVGAHPRFMGGSITNYTKPPHSHLIARGVSSAIAHNGTVPGLKCRLGEIDTDVMLRAYKQHGIEWVIEHMPAAYSAVIIDSKSDEAMVFRDRHGIRPAWIGEKDGKIVAASEDVAIWDIGGKPIREVSPGEVIFINNSNNYKRKQVVDSADPKTPCFYEYNYNSGISSAMGGKTINDVCRRLGFELAREFRPEVDFVTYLPNRPLPMARAYAEARGLPFVDVFYKVKKERAFLGSNPEQRKKSIGDNLFVKDNVDLRGKRIVVIDDSTVRLNNAPDASHKLKKMGVAWMGMGLCTPVIGEETDGIEHGCRFGVDMPPDDDFAIRRYGSVEGIRQASGFDEIHYISKEGLSRAHRVPLEHRCTYCIGGPSPVTEDEMRELENLEI